MHLSTGTSKGTYLQSKLYQKGEKITSKDIQPGEISNILDKL